MHTHPPTQNNVSQGRDCFLAREIIQETVFICILPILSVMDFPRISHMDTVDSPHQTTHPQTYPQAERRLCRRIGAG
jgi:hypothetical protein